MNPLRNEDGMVLLFVLVLVAFLSAVLVQLGYTTLVDIRLTETFRDSTQAYYLAKGGAEAGRMLVEEDRNGYDAVTELWGQEISNYPVGDGVVSIRIEDTGGRLDLNRLVKEGNVDVYFKERAIRLFDALLFDNPEGLTAALIDWTDPDESVYSGGAESGTYRSRGYPAKNASLDSVEELLLVEGFTPEMLETLRPHVTVWGQEKVNINTATAQVLAALVEETTAADAEAIVDARNGIPFENLEDLKQLPGHEGWYFALKPYVQVKSEYYRVAAEAWIGVGRRRAEAVFEKGKKGPRYWKVE